MFVTIVVILCCVHTCVGHLCMFSPPQRTPLKDINKQGSNSCMLINAPCGGAKSTASPLAIVGGSKFTVVFQKNLDHFYKANPGNWTISIAKSESSKFTEVYRVRDSATASLTLYTADITLPRVQKPTPVIVQSRYITNNPQAPPNFYQCSDLLLLPSN